MLRLLRWLIWGDAHLHKWTPYGKVTAMYMKDDEDDRPSRRQQSFQCETCGKIRIFDI